MGREWYHDRDEEGGAGRGKERWLITYADLITLLLVFFIVMYALSARINMQTFEQVSHSLAAALKKPSPKPGDKFAYAEDDSKQTKRF
ncbi:MAG TPA: flagellar motor protein MotB, partial [Oscillatoriaceae cyanobacterium]